MRDTKSDTQDETVFEAERRDQDAREDSDERGDRLDAEAVPEPRQPDATREQPDPAEEVDFAEPNARQQTDRPPLEDALWGEDKGALGEGFAPGAYDQNHQWNGKEQAIADRLADSGAAVHARTRYDTEGSSNPDAMVRRSPEDDGVVTEFKTLDVNTPGAISGNIRDGGDQVGQHGGGDVVIDGRNVSLTAEQAELGHAQAPADKEQYGSSRPLPDRVHYILADNSIMTRDY